MSEKTQRYQNLDNGTIVDKKTGLHWMRCSLGQKWEKENCTGNPASLNWNRAIMVVQKLNEGNGYAGYKDWRLPTIDELKTIVREDKSDPSINTNIFPNTPSDWFWSASSDKENPEASWLINFYNGECATYNKNSNVSVRLVRQSEQTKEQTSSDPKDSVAFKYNHQTHHHTENAPKTTSGNDSRNENKQESLKTQKNQTISHNDLLKKIKSTTGSFFKSEKFINILSFTFILLALFFLFIDNVSFIASISLLLSGILLSSLINPFLLKKFNTNLIIKSKIISISFFLFLGFIAQVLGTSSKVQHPYIIAHEGTVTDVHTGLIWMRCTVGQTWHKNQCVGTAEQYRWSVAQNIAQNYTFAGFNDWRLPSIEELSTLIFCSSSLKNSSTMLDGCNENHQVPTIYMDFFPNTPAYLFWSSSPDVNDASFAKTFDFSEGKIRNNFILNSSYIRLVR